MRVVEIVSRAASLASGLLLLYGALFLYEDEEGKLQNTIENWWIRLDDLRRRVVSRHNAFLSVVAEVATKFFDRLLGPQLLSLHQIFVVGCLALMSLVAYAYVSWGLMLFRTTGEQAAEVHLCCSFLSWEHAYVAGLFALSFSEKLLVPRGHGLLAFGLAAALAIAACTKYTRLRWLPMFVVLFFFALVFSVDDRPATGLSPAELAAICLWCSNACSVVAFAAVRKLLKKQWLTRSVRTAVVAAVLQVLIGLLLILAPLWFGNKFLRNGDFSRNIAAAIMASLGVNLFAGALMLTGAAAAASMVIHRAVWPVASRVLYRVARIRVFKSPSARGALLLFALALIGFGCGDADGVLAKLLAFFGSA
jgi:hypothetical protein